MSFTQASTNQEAIEQQTSHAGLTHHRDPLRGLGVHARNTRGSYPQGTIVAYIVSAWHIRRAPDSTALSRVREPEKHKSSPEAFSTTLTTLWRGNRSKEALRVNRPLQKYHVLSGDRSWRKDRQ